MLRLLPLDPGLSTSSDPLWTARKCRFLSVISHILNVSTSFKLILKTMFVKQNSLCAYSDLQATILPTWSNRIPWRLSRVNALQYLLRTAKNLCSYPSLPDQHWDNLINPCADPQLRYRLSPVMPDPRPQPGTVRWVTWSLVLRNSEIQKELAVKWDTSFFSLKIITLSQKVKASETTENLSQGCSASGNVLLQWQNQLHCVVGTLGRQRDRALICSKQSFCCYHLGHLCLWQFIWWSFYFAPWKDYNMLRLGAVHLSL